MYKNTCLIILFLSGGWTELILDGNNVTVKLKTVIKDENDSNRSNVIINIKEIKSGRRDLDYSDNKESTSTPLKLLDFQNFLNQAISILSSYDDKDLEDIFAVIDEEVRKYRYNGKGIKTWARTSDTLKHILKKLEVMKDTSGDNLRRNLNQILTLKDNNFGENVTQLIDLIGSLYKDDAAFLSVINDLNQYKYQSKRSNIYLSDMVKRCLQSLVFEPYKKMERKNKNALNLKMNIFLKKVSVKDVRTYKQETDEKATNLELQFIPQLKVEKIHAALDRLKKNQYRGSEIGDDNLQNYLKHNLRQGFQNINVESTDIAKKDIINFILSLIGSLGDSSVRTTTTKSSTQAEILMAFIKSLVKSFPSKKSKPVNEDRIY